MKILLLIICLIFLAGCTKELAEDKLQISIGVQKEPGVKEISKGVEEIQVPENAVEIDEELAELIEKSKSLQSLEYSYSDGDNFFYAYTKGDKMKIKFSSFPSLYDPRTVWNVVYIDKEKKTAEAYCEDKEECEDIDIPRKVDYEDFIVETPFDVIDSIKQGELKKGTIVDNRETKIVEIPTQEGYVKIVWLWIYNGLPLKYEVWQGSNKIKRVDYKISKIDNVKDSDLVH